MLPLTRGGPAFPADCVGLPAHQRRPPPRLMCWPRTSLPASSAAGTRRPPTSRAPDPALRAAPAHQVREHTAQAHLQPPEQQRLPPRRACAAAGPATRTRTQPQAGCLSGRPPPPWAGRASRAASTRRRLHRYTQHG
jgi:hypothetical protein